MAEIINGKIVSQKLREDIKREVDLFVEKRGYAPGLAVIVVGNDPASAVYVRNKHRACGEVGITSYQIESPHIKLNYRRILPNPNFSLKFLSLTMTIRLAEFLFSCLCRQVLMRSV